MQGAPGTLLHPQPILAQLTLAGLLVPTKVSRQLVVVLNMVNPCTACMAGVVVKPTVIALRWVVVIRGGKIPCVVEPISSTAAALGDRSFITTLPEAAVVIFTLPVSFRPPLSVVRPVTVSVPPIVALLPTFNVVPTVPAFAILKFAPLCTVVPF